MKKWYVYEIVNLMGTVEYVGESIDLKKRWYNHKCINGKFHNRSDIFMNIVKEFNNKKDAFFYQCQLQSEYGLETDSNKMSRPQQKGRKHSFQTIEKMKEKRKHQKNVVKAGWKHSTETLKKMSDKLKGRVISDEHKQKLSEASKAMWIKRKQIVK